MFRRLMLFCVRRTFYPESSNLQKSSFLLITSSARKDATLFSELLTRYVQPASQTTLQVTAAVVMYLFSAAKSNQLFLVDTHPISAQLGGMGNGLIKVYPAQDSESSKPLCAWIWGRLQHSGVPETAQQSFLILDELLR